MQGSQAAASQAPVGGGGGCRCRGGPSPGPLSPEPYRQIARPYRQCLAARSAAKQLPPPARHTPTQPGLGKLCAQAARRLLHRSWRLMRALRIAATASRFGSECSDWHAPRTLCSATAADGSVQAGGRAARLPGRRPLPPAAAPACRSRRSRPTANSPSNHCAPAQAPLSAAWPRPLTPNGRRWA